MTRWLNDDEQAAWRGLLRMTARLNARLNHQLLQAHGLSLADYDVLVPLSEAADGRLRVFEIAQTLSWEQSRLSHHLTRMQRRGLIERQECPTDHRGAYAVLTDRGRAAITAAAPGHADLVRHLVFDGLAPGQVATLTAVTAHVMDQLDASPPATQETAAA